MKKICRNCGSVETKGARFCRRCGSDALAPYEPPRGKWRGIGSFAMYLGIWFELQSVTTVLFLIPFFIKFFIDNTAVDTGSGLILAPSFRNLTVEYVEYVMKYLNVISIVSSAAFLAAVAIIFIIRQRRRERRGVLPEKNLFREIGLVGAPVSSCLFAIVFGAALNRIVTMIVDMIPWPGWFIESFEQNYEPMTGNSVPLWLVIISVAIMAPITEETLFRGIGCSRLSSGFPKIVVIVITSVAFGVAHGTPIAIAYATVFGVIQALVFLRHRSLLPAVLSHFAFNLTATLTENTWDNQVLNYALFFIAAALVVVSLFFILKKPKTEEVSDETV